MEKIPEAVFREAIANALIHREWDVDSHIRVSMFDDRVEVVSPAMNLSTDWKAHLIV